MMRLQPLMLLLLLPFGGCWAHIEVVWELELKLEVIKVSNEKEVAVKKELTVRWWDVGWWLESLDV